MSAEGALGLLTFAEPAPKANRPKRRERYAKHILWMAVYRIILRAWDSTRKRIWHGGVVLYRSR
jgi:hypothetical protein